MFVFFSFHQNFLLLYFKLCNMCNEQLLSWYICLLLYTILICLTLRSYIPCHREIHLDHPQLTRGKVLQKQERDVIIMCFGFQSDPSPLPQAYICHLYLPHLHPQGYITQHLSRRFICRPPLLNLHPQGCIPLLYHPSIYHPHLPQLHTLGYIPLPQTLEHPHHLILYHPQPPLVAYLLPLVNSLHHPQLQVIQLPHSLWLILIWMQNLTLLCRIAR